jgi:TonB family protein
MARTAILALAALALLACRPKSDGAATLPSSARPVVERGDEPPVALNARSPVIYPVALAQQGIGGTVLLRLFADSTGKLVDDSSRIAESSGYPALDSAALAAAPKLRFSPALLKGAPVAGAFIQPVQFRNPGSQEIP